MNANAVYALRVVRERNALRQPNDLQSHSVLFDLEYKRRRLLGTAFDVVDLVTDDDGNPDLPSIITAANWFTDRTLTILKDEYACLEDAWPPDKVDLAEDFVLDFFRMYFYSVAHRIWGERELDTMLRLAYACGQNPRTLYYVFEEYYEIRLSNGENSDAEAHMMADSEEWANEYPTAPPHFSKAVFGAVCAFLGLIPDPTGKDLPERDGVSLGAFVSELNEIATQIGTLNRKMKLTSRVKMDRTDPDQREIYACAQAALRRMEEGCRIACKADDLLIEYTVYESLRESGGLDDDHA